MMKIYTKTGDEGETGLFGGPRVSKDHIRIEAYGQVDELNAFLGLSRCENLPRDLDASIEQIQNDLFHVGAMLATPKPENHANYPSLLPRVAEIERQIDELESELVPLQQFILPGGNRAAASMHVCRTICRRAERHVISLTHIESEFVPKEIVVYLNRISDLLFVMGRIANARSGLPDVPWTRRQ